MSITKVSWLISTFNVTSCSILFIYRFMLFYGYIQMTNTEDQNRLLVVTRKEFNPNRTRISDADFGIICEMSAYFLGILFNAMLPLGVNTAREKNFFFFFPPYYVVSAFLSLATFIIGLINASPVYIGFSVLNIFFLVAVIAIHRAVLREEIYARKYNADNEM